MATFDYEKATEETRQRFIDALAEAMRNVELDPSRFVRPSSEMNALISAAAANRHARGRALDDEPMPRIGAMDAGSTNQLPADPPAIVLRPRFVRGPDGRITHVDYGYVPILEPQLEPQPTRIRVVLAQWHVPPGSTLHWQAEHGQEFFLPNGDRLVAFHAHAGNQPIHCRVIRDGGQITIEPPEHCHGLFRRPDGTEYLVRGGQIHTLDGRGIGNEVRWQDDPVESNAREFAREVVEADKRAHDLLIEWLTPEQREQFERRGKFIAIGQTTGRRYVLERGLVTIINAFGDRQGALCFHPNMSGDERTPLCDRMLTQKLALETDEKATLKIANSFS